MLGDNLRELRKEKGMSQEELATRINVVRQTVSKWEKNLSVPDAEMLQKIALELDVSVEKLLGEKISRENDPNEIAQQLARINEQLAVKNKRSGRIIKMILIVIGTAIVTRILIAAAGAVLYSNMKSSKTMSTSIEMNADDPIYDEDELVGAMNVLEKYFDANCKGALLSQVAYDETDDRNEQTKYAEIYNEEFAVVLTSDFKTSDKVTFKATYLDVLGENSTEQTDASQETIAPNKTYKGVKWLLTKSGTQDWAVQGYGY